MSKWSDEETVLLTDCYCHATNEKLKEIFPNRTLISVYKKARSLGLEKSSEVKFVNRSNAKKGEKCVWWKGGTTSTSKGYRAVKNSEHHRADKKGYVMEHIAIFENATGIKVPEDCCVHHLNGDKTDNRIQNLCLMTRYAHTVLHHTGAKRSAETKAKLSQKAKERFKDERNHPSYRAVDVDEMKRMRKSGMAIKEICKKLGICRSTYYKKMENVK